MLQALGGPVPPNTDHAVSVSLPSWRENVGYEEGEDWVISKMKCGYPRFFVHPIIQKLAQEIVRRVGDPNLESATLFPSLKSARICHSFLLSKIPAEKAYKARIVNFIPSLHTEAGSTVTSSLSCVIYPKEYASITKQVWQHSGNGISSRRGEFCLGALEDGFLVEDKGFATAESISQGPCKGPRRYQSVNGVRKGSVRESPPKSNTEDGRDYAQFIEERFGRNLSTSLANQAKLAVRKRIAGVLTADAELPEALETASSEGRVAGISEEDVLLYPSGMSAIFNAHQTLLATRGDLPSICFGFPYTDTLKILQKWGPGCVFYGHGSSEDLEDLESRLKAGERFLGLFTEAPGNPLLKTPDLKRIRALADQYGFAVVVDETISNFLNINVLHLADIVVSSLTKIFSGDMKEVHYPKYSPTRPLYDSLRNANGGYGGLFSVTFHSTAEAIAFFDTIEVLKGPSLGTNFTLSSPYVLLAHYGELDWARSFDVDPDLVRISVGLEDVHDLRSRVQRALDAVQSVRQPSA
ncbi:hypothetical protein N7497_007866 [Penicillium chrysogenum]|nr:hypothetical protein N7497_007866 [Penicillium chrysogenum]